MVTFLAINGVEITATSEETIAFLVPLYDGHAISHARLEAWLRENTRGADG